MSRDLNIKYVTNAVVIQGPILHWPSIMWPIDNYRMTVIIREIPTFGQWLEENETGWTYWDMLNHNSDRRFANILPAIEMISAMGSIYDIVNITDKTALNLYAELHVAHKLQYGVCFCFA